MSRLRRVLLVDPGQSFAEGGSRHATRQTPHIGLACLASVAQAIADVRVLDMPLMGANDDDLRRAVADFEAGDIVGITTATFNLPEALDAARVVKEINPAIVTLVGGPHVNAFPTDVPKRSVHVDAAVVGEGERILEHIIFNHGKPGFDWDIPGVVTCRDGVIRYQPPTSEWHYENLDDLPLPDWTFLGLDRYWKRYSSRFDRMEQLAPLSTIRGCPYRCSFCDPNNLTEKLRYRSARHTVDEIAHSLKTWGLRHYYITDSVMSVPKPRFRQFCEEMRDSGLAAEVSLIGQANINAIDEDMITLFRDAGGEYIFFGLESGNEEVLRLNGKPVKRERVIRMTNHAHDLGLTPRGSFILGLPFDTERTVMDTIEFATETLKLHSANFFVLDFYPGTAALRYLVAGEAGFVMPEGGIDWDNYVPSRNRAKVKVGDLEPERLDQLLALAKSRPLPYHDAALALRQEVTEFLYYAEAGRWDDAGRAAALDSLMSKADRAGASAQGAVADRLARAAAFQPVRENR